MGTRLRSLGVFIRVPYIGILIFWSFLGQGISIRFLHESLNPLQFPYVLQGPGLDINFLGLRDWGLGLFGAPSNPEPLNGLKP